MEGVVMLVNEFPPLPVGGAETQAERLSAYLAGQGWPVWVITRHGSGLPFQEERSGFQIVRPPTLGTGKIRTITFMLFALIKLYRMRHQYKILHAHLAYGPAFIAVFLGRLLGKRVVVKLGGSNAIGDVNVSLNTWRGRLRLAAIRKWADVVVVLTDVMRDEALSIGIPENRVQLFNNGIDVSAYVFDQTSKNDAKDLLGLTDNTVLLFVGRLDPIKSLSTILEAIKIALKSYPAFHLLIVGDGSERSFLEDQVRVLGIDKNVTFAGNQKDVLPYLQAANIFVLPSITEGISNALLEAMAAGLACMATPVGGNNEVLAHGKYGRMVPVRDVRAWAEALVDLGNNAQLRDRLGEIARLRISEHYDFNIVGNQYESLYIDLLGK
jgi:glycosyltransferase involved in cell wall biosynthesis